MIAREREKMILADLRRYGQVDASELAVRLGVSALTVRRDLNALHDAGKLERVHGGAVRPGGRTADSDDVLRVGIIVPASGYYYADVIQGAASITASLNVRLLLGVSGEGPQEEPVHQLLSLGIDALMVTTPTGPRSEGHEQEWLAEVSVPTVLVERSIDFPRLSVALDHVRTDHAYGAGLALRHLHDLGHSCIGILLAQTATTPWLEVGAVTTAEHLGIGESVRITHVAESADSSQIRAIVDEWLGAGITAAVVHHDYIAHRLVEVARHMGLVIPDDLSIVGYDDVLAAGASPPLTAVAPPRAALGRHALELVARRARQPRGQHQPVTHVELLPELVIRSSTGSRAG